jgi:CRP/FNR family transcriptional regulator, cyclic AMP receptor protein
MPEKSVATHTQKVVSLKTGEFLFRQDDMTHDLYILKKGAVRIFKMEGGIEIDLDTIGPGNVVGEVASIDGGPRTASVIALEPSEALLLPATEFKSILAAIPEWFRKIAMILVQRLREVDTRISRSVDGERTNHVAAVISLLAFTDQCVACPSGFFIDLKTIEHLVIDLLDIPISEITESIERLHKQEYLRLDRSGVVLANREVLDDLAEKVFHITPEVPAT